MSPGCGSQRLVCVGAGQLHTRCPPAVNPSGFTFVLPSPGASPFLATAKYTSTCDMQPEVRTNNMIWMSTR